MNYNFITEYAFKQKWGNANQDEMSLKELTEFKEDCFKMYETYGFQELFNSPYDEPAEHNGMPFKVLRRATTDECDLEAMPLWYVEFENGDHAYCYPEEICILEYCNREHGLYDGERVFDNGNRVWAHVLRIEDGMAWVQMTHEDLEENVKMFDEEIPYEEEGRTWCVPTRDLYQIAPGIYGRDGNPVCYEHNYTRDLYPYYSPYLDENLFHIEVSRKETAE